MMTVQVEPERMRAQNVTLDSVMEATADSVDSGLLRFSNGSIIGTGGSIETCRNSGSGSGTCCRSSPPADLAQVTVDSKTGARVPLGSGGRRQG